MIANKHPDRTKDQLSQPKDHVDKKKKKKKKKKERIESNIYTQINSL